MRPTALILPLLLALAPALAAEPPMPAPAARAEVAPLHRVEQLSAHAFAVFGPGGNVGVLVGDREALVIDGQYDRTAEGLLKAIRTVTDKPLRYLVNTHHHPDHTGGNALLARQGAVVVAHANVRPRLELAQAKLDPAQRGGLPEVMTGDGTAGSTSRLDLHLAGLEVHLVHRGAAHTDGDLLVGFPAEHVLHMGDLFFHGMLPFIDVDGGGSFDGLVAELDWLLTWLPADVRLIPGHGSLCGRPELVRYRDLLKAVQAHARAHAGLAPPELARTFPAADWPEGKPTPGFVTWETLFQVATGKGPGRVMKP
jgi:cyclase